MRSIPTIYCDNVIVSGKVRNDLQKDEMHAVRKLLSADADSRVKLVTSKKTWIEQDRTRNPFVRAQLEEDRPSIPLVKQQDRLLSFHFQADRLGGFITYPLISDIVDEKLFAALKERGLKDADAQHLMYAVCNKCDHFVTTDPHFLDRRESLKSICGATVIYSPVELVQELNL